jgi:hypothetical protein
VIKDVCDETTLAVPAEMTVGVGIMLRYEDGDEEKETVALSLAVVEMLNAEDIEATLLKEFNEVEVAERESVVKGDKESTRDSLGVSVCCAVWVTECVADGQTVGGVEKERLADADAEREE